MFVVVCINVFRIQELGRGLVGGGERDKHVLSSFFLAPLDVQLLLGFQILLTDSVCVCGAGVTRKGAVSSCPM